MPKKIGVFIVAYNAVGTIAKVLDRIPPDIREKIAEVFIFDDCSTDDTYLLGVGYKQTTGWDKLQIYRNTENKGYGGNQKLGYRYAIDNDFDIVVLLHGDGQYAPECMAQLIEPIERGEAEAVFGSRMMDPGAARRGGMPIYKYIGNKILTRFENSMLGMDLTEFHSGYRAYDVHALARIPFEKNSDDFHFDTEIIIQFHQHKLRIGEVPIPTYYGDEICYVNGMKYAGNVVKSIVRYRLNQAGVKSYPEYKDGTRYPIKRDRYSSHALISERIKGAAPRVLDIGCGPGNVAALIRQKDFECVGVDLVRDDDLAPGVGTFHQMDLEKGLDLEYGAEFDYVVFGDILEHLTHPERLLKDARRFLKSGGRIIVSVPNITHWSIRLMLLTGNFNYMERGILDKTHMRFFTRKSMTRLLGECGFETVEVSGTPVPLGSLIGTYADSRLYKMISAIQYRAANFWKNLFAYQLIFVARQTPVPAQAIDAPQVEAAPAVESTEPSEAKPLAHA